MEKYLIYKKQSDGTKVYVEYIYRTSVSTDTDLGDAIEFDSKELALMMAEYLKERDNSKYYVLGIKTTFEEVTE